MMSLYHAQQHENTLHTWPTVFTAMSASSDDAAKDDRAPSFAWGCPLGDDECPKAKQWLGGTKQSLWSEERCRQAVLDHLMCSPYHNEMTSTEVTMKKTTGMAMMYEQQLNMKGGENWAVSKVIVDVENLKCKRCWTKTEPKKSKKRSKAMKAMKTMKAAKRSKAMKAMKTMKAMKKTTGKAKTAMKAKKHMKAKNPMKMMKVVKAMKVMKAKNHMNTMKAVKVMKAKNPMITMKAMRYWGP